MCVKFCANSSSKTQQFTAIFGDELGQNMELLFVTYSGGM